MFTRQQLLQKKWQTLSTLLLILLILFCYPSLALAFSYYVSVNTAANTGTFGYPNDKYYEISYDDKTTLFSENTVAGPGFSAHAIASVNLASGAIMAKAEASGTGSAIAAASFADKLTFSSSRSDQVTVTVKWDVTGSISLGAYGDDSWTRFRLVTLEQKDFTYGDSEAHFTQTVTLDPGEELTYDFFGEIQLAFVRYGAFDFFQTGEVSFDIPEGVTMTSESGVFLTQVDVVPLPGAVWLFGSGLLGLGALGWRRRRKD